MLDLTKKVLPSAVLVEGTYYPIHTEHYYWFRFSRLIHQPKLMLQDVRFLYIDKVPENEQAGFTALEHFFYEPQELPRATDDGGTRLLDYELDADLIYAAMYEQYGIDLVSTPMHWHKIRALIAGLHDTKLTDVIGYRCYSGKDAEFNKMRRAWELPQNDNGDAKGDGDELDDEDISIIMGK